MIMSESQALHWTQTKQPQKGSPRPVFASRHGNATLLAIEVNNTTIA